MAEEEKAQGAQGGDSIYGDGDRVETTIDTSPDMFDDVFGEDDEKKASKKKMEERAKELEKNIGKKAAKEEAKEAAEKEADSKKEKSKEPEIFADKSSEDDFESKDDVMEAQDSGLLHKKKGGGGSDFDEQIKKGLEKSIKNSSGGKLDLKTTIEEEPEEEEEEEIAPASPVEKNIIKSVIRNKAMKVAKEEEAQVQRAGKASEEDEENAMLDDLMKEDGTKEEGVSEEALEEEEEDEIGVDNDTIVVKGKKKAAKEAAPTRGKRSGVEELAEEAEQNVELIENEAAEISEKDAADKVIKPKMDFLMSAQKRAFIGRKKSVLGKYGEEGGLFVGRVYEETMKDTDILLDGLNPHVVFVCGARGSGKSYVLGVIAEELALKNRNVGIVVVDPIGVFWSMKHPNKEEKELETLTKWNMLPRGLDNIKVFIPVGMKESVPKSTYDAVFSIQPALLTADDWCLTFGIDRFSPTGLLMEKGIAKAKGGYTTIDGKQIRGKQNTFSLEDLIDCFGNDSELNDKNRGYKSDSIRALVSRFDAAKHWGIFDEKGTPLSQLSKAGQMTILDTSFLEDNVSALVIGIIARRVLSARKLSTRREAAGKFAEEDMEDLVELNIPPTWLFIDEAHTLIPAGNQKTPASNALVEYVKQGRRPGCSLVFATQQPSAIDSKVLSQLDIIMAHKLVFDDDIKAIYKRTPAIIPWQYKKPNFIKTMPVGIALTGDRSETTARAFIMAIRPRMSQHEGRDAETVEVRHELEKEQVEILAVNMVLRQLEKDPRISVESVGQTLESLNDTYKKEVKLDTVLAALKKKGLFIEEGYVLASGVKEELEQEKREQALKDRIAAGAKAGKSSLSVLAEEAEKAIDGAEEGYEEKDYEESVELMALQPAIDDPAARKMLAKFRLKKTLGLFGEEEIIDRLALKYAIIYKVKFNYFSQKNAFQICEAYVNSLTGEFIHDINGSLVESRGLSKMLKMNETEATAFKLLQKKRSAEEMAKLLRMEKGNAKRVLEDLVESGFAIAVPNKETTYYALKEGVDLPPSPLHAILPSIGKRPITEVASAALIPPTLAEKYVPELLKKMWGNVSVKEITHIFLPVWEAVMKKKTGEERTERIDAINGKRML